MFVFLIKFHLSLSSSVQSLGPDNGPLTRYVKLRVAHAPGTFSRQRLQTKPLISEPGMYRGTCVTHVPWCMSGSLTRGGRENVPNIPGACPTRNFTYLVWFPWYGHDESGNRCQNQWWAMLLTLTCVTPPLRVEWDIRYFDQINVYVINRHKSWTIYVHKALEWTDLLGWMITQRKQAL